MIVVVVVVIVVAIGSFNDAVRSSDYIASNDRVYMDRSSRGLT
jgi:uncharacterized membrane protein YciS (DUF1049 family)